MSLVPCGCNSSPALVEQGPGSTDHHVYQEHGIFQRVAVEFPAGACKTLVLMGSDNFRRHACFGETNFFYGEQQIEFRLTPKV